MASIATSRSIHSPKGWQVRRSVGQLSAVVCGPSRCQNRSLISRLSPGVSVAEKAMQGAMRRKHREIPVHRTS